MKKAVFAGGTYCGKTTLIERYRLSGYFVIPEVAFQVVTEWKERLGFDEYRKWRLHNAEEFFNSIFERQIEVEKNVPEGAGLALLDRGVIDVIAMCKYFKVNIPAHVLNYAQKNRYDKIFICDVLPNFDTRTETGRIFTEEDSKKLTELIHEEYLAYGYIPTRLPPSSVEERIVVIDSILRST